MLRLTKGKLARACLLACSLPLAVLLRTIPREWDVLDLAEIASGFLRVMVGGPIFVFDLLTGSAFAPRSEGFLVFPSTTQLLFALLANALVFYGIACVWDRVSTRRIEDSKSAEN